MHRQSLYFMSLRIGCLEQFELVKLVYILFASMFHTVRFELPELSVLELNRQVHVVNLVAVNAFVQQAIIRQQTSDSIL